MAQDMPAPPEAQVIKLARMAARMSVDDAVAEVRAAGGKISATYWRDVERGHGGRRGRRVPVRASEGLLAQMADAVNASADRLAGAGREDAARVLEEMRRRENPAEPVTTSGSMAIPPPAITAEADVKAQVYALFKQVNEDIEAQVRAEIRAAKAAYKRVPLDRVPESGTEDEDSGLPGAAIPTFSTYERAVWDLAVSFDEEERARRIIDARAADATRRSSPRVRRAGLKPPDGLTA